VVLVGGGVVFRGWWRPARRVVALWRAAGVVLPAGGLPVVAFAVAGARGGGSVLCVGAGGRLVGAPRSAVRAAGRCPVWAAAWAAAGGLGWSGVSGVFAAAGFPVVPVVGG
jgi:hypothetical protein